MTLAGHRSDTWRVEAALLLGDTRVDLGTWDKKSGGGIDSDDLKYYPGGMEDPESLGGRRTVDNWVISRRYGTEFFDRVISTPDQGAVSLIGVLKHQAGRGRMHLSQTPLDNDGKPYGRPENVNGTLKRVSSPDVDNEGGSAAMIELEVSIKGFPAMGQKNG